MNKKTITLFGSIIAVAAIASVMGIQMVDSIQTNNLDRNCMTAQQSKTVATFHKVPTYMPSGYDLECISITEPYRVSMIATSLTEVHDGWQTESYARPQTITITQLDEKSLLGDERFSEELTAQQRIQADITSIEELNPRLNPVYVNIDGLSAFVTEACEQCGIQTATFANGEVIKNSFAMPSRLKIIDDAGFKTVLVGHVSVDELIQIAKSLQ